MLSEIQFSIKIWVYEQNFDFYRKSPWHKNSILNSSNSPYRRAGEAADGESLTVGNVRPNKNVDTLNNLNYIGCGFSQVNEKHLMAVSNQFFNSYSNCGREMILKYLLFSDIRFHITFFKLGYFLKFYR